MRMHSRFWRLAAFAIAMTMTAALCAAATSPESTRPALSGNRILFALAVRDVPVRTAEVEFLAPIFLNHPRATLKLEHLERWQGDSGLARISCAAAGECLPFFVIVRWDDPRERELALGAATKEPLPVQKARKNEPAKPFLVRAGESATLFLENAKMHIATPIICLQNGSQGQQIRVSSLDHKRIVMAEVVDFGVLKGSL
jgi:hypothetical protein